MHEHLRVSESVGIGVAIADCAHWHCQAVVEKRWDGDAEPYDVVTVDGNIVVTAGATAIWTALTQGTAGAFQNATAALGVGDSSTAAAVGQTDLQAETNKLRKTMAATYPQVSTNTCVFRAEFGSSDANFVWNEYGIFSADTGGTMLNRKVAAMGTKVSGSTWTVTVTLSLS